MICRSPNLMLYSTIGYTSDGPRAVKQTLAHQYPTLRSGQQCQYSVRKQNFGNLPPIWLLRHSLTTWKWKPTLFSIKKLVSKGNGGVGLTSKHWGLKDRPDGRQGSPKNTYVCTWITVTRSIFDQCRLYRICNGGVPDTNSNTGRV